MDKLPKLKSYFYGFLTGTFLSWLAIPLFEKHFNNDIKELPDKNILVLDNFSEKVIEINDDDTCDITHGELISKIIETGLPGYNVERKGTYISSVGGSFDRERLFNNILNGKKYKAANVSIGAEISFDELSERTGINVTSENIALKAREIKTYLKEHPDKYLKNGNSFLPAEMGGVANFIDVLDSLSAMGTKIYVSTCNEGPRYLNLVSLVDGAIVVGAADSTGTKYYSSENTLVKKHYADTVKITKTKDGYSIDNGKTTAFMNTQVSKGSNKPYAYTHQGASFATPRVLITDLKMHK